MRNRILLIALATSIVALCSGCALLLVGAAAGAGTAVYVNGEMSSEEAIPFDRAWNAAQAGVKDMQYAITEQQKDAGAAKLTARGAGDKKIEVKLEKVSGTVTRFRIRVGLVGDKVISNQILEKVKSHF